MGRCVITLLCLGLIIMMGNSEDTWECKLPCKCKWMSGKKAADCIKLNYTNIPNYLSAEIQILDLTGNRINHLSERAFTRVGLENLHKLIMKDCGITSIHTEAFTGLKIVIELDLSGNNIKNLLPGTFLGTQRLRVLSLNNNLLEKLNNGLFHDLVYLQRVEISNNNLQEIGEHTFKNLTRLQTLKLDDNNLSNVKLITFEHLPKLSSLELQNNPWNCNCHLKKFRDWTIEHKLYTKPTTCNQPSTLTGKMWDEVDSDEFACQPKILSIGPLSPFEIVNGNVVRMWCHAAGIPRPQLSWVHRSRILNNSTKRYNSERNYILTEHHEWLNLTIIDVMPNDKGEYNCIAKSPGGIVEKTVNLSITGDNNIVRGGIISLPLALGLGITLLILFIFVLALCWWYCCHRNIHHDEKHTDVTLLENHGLGEQEKSLITAINPVVKPPRRYDAPSVTSHGTEMTELNRTLLDSDSVFADGVGSVIGVVGGIGEMERGNISNGGININERSTPDHDSATLTRGASYRHYPPDLLAFSDGRGVSPTSQASTAPDTTRTPNQQMPSFNSPSSGQYPIAFKTLPHNRSATSAYNSPSMSVMPRHGYVTIPRRPRAPSWSSGPPISPTSNEPIEPVYDNLGLRTTADGSSVLSLNKSPEPGTNPMRIRPLPSTPTIHYNNIQRSTPNILSSSSPVDRSAPEGAAEWFTKLPDEMENRLIIQHNPTSDNATNTLGRKIPPRPPPKPKKKSTNGPLYEDEDEDGTEV